MPIVRGTVSGLRLPVEAVRLLRSQPAIRRAALVPFLVSAVALLAGVLGIVTWWADLWALASGWVPWPEAESWWAWLWVGPLRALGGVLALLGFVVLSGAVLVIAFLIGNVAAAPFLDRLSRRVEETVVGQATDVSAAGLAALAGGAARSAVEEVKRVAFFLVAQLAIVVPGALIPGLQPFAAAAMVALTVFFLAIDSAGYALDRRGQRFRAKLRWSRLHLARVAGFGAAAFALCSIPVVNLVALPVLVVAGTLLVLDTEGRTGSGVGPTKAGGD